MDDRLFRILAATEVMKGINPNTIVHRTQALHGLFDGLVGLSWSGREKSRAGFGEAFLLAMQSFTDLSANIYHGHTYKRSENFMGQSCKQMLYARLPQASGRKIRR